MTHKHGAYLGGIRTIADLRERCTIDGDCWVWRGGLSGGKPSINARVEGKLAAHSGRRLAANLGGKTVRAGQVAYQSVNCCNVLCVSPAHAMLGSLADAMRASEVRDGWKRVGYRAKAAARITAVSAKLTAQQASEIRDSVGCRKAVAEKYGISPSQVTNIRNGTCWRAGAVATNSSVFAWRGAA